MDRTFQNQLNKEEINVGILLYIFWKLWLFVLPFAVLCLIIASSSKSWGVVAGFVIGVALSSGICFIVLKRIFSPDRVATYTMYDGRLEIINDDGSAHSFSQNEIKMAENNKIYLLFLGKNRFAIVAKRNLDEEQKKYFRSIIKEN